MVAPGEAGPGSGAGPVLQFFTRLRRHASLDGASPYFKVKKWKLEPNQRASSLDTRGSPKRHHFQRQRAASESMEQEEGDTSHVDFIQYIASAGATMAFPPHRPFLASPTSPPPTLGRYFSVDRGARGGPVGPCPTPSPLGGPGSTLPALRTGGRVPQVPPLLEAASLGPPLQYGPEEGSRGKLGKGRVEGGALDNGPRVPRTGRLLGQGCRGSMPSRVVPFLGGVHSLRDPLPSAHATEGWTAASQKLS